MFSLVLSILALVLFTVAAFLGRVGRVHLGWLGAACLTLATLLGGAGVDLD